MSGQRPQVTVVVPAFNREQFLRRTIESVLAQTYEAFELIVVDDGSTDDTASLVASYADPRVRCVRHEEALGAQAARNSGIRAAAGEYIAFLDSDDEWLPQKLTLQMELLAASPRGVGVVHSYYEMVSDDGKRLGLEAFKVEGNARRSLLQRPSVHFSTAVVRKEYLEKIGNLDESVPAWQEWDTFIRLSEVCEFAYVPEVLTRYHVHSTGFRNPERALRGYSYIIEKHGSEIVAVCGKLTLAKHYLELSRLAREAGDRLLARSYLRKGISIWPPLPVYAGLRAGLKTARGLRKSVGSGLTGKPRESL